MARTSDQDQQAIDRLYALPLDEFTAARDELAGRLRREGKGDVAAEVKRLRKPAVPAWALNQVRRSNPRQVDELLEAGHGLREAHERLLGSGDREPLTRAAEEERRLVAELARQAERELMAAGRSVGASVQERLRETLHAAATDPEARELIASGRLVRDHAPSGFGPLGTEAQATSAEPRQAGKRSAERLDGARARKAERLEQRLGRARMEREQAHEELSEARRRLRDARGEAARAASALERAEQAEEKAARRAQQASERAAELEADLRDL